MFKVDEALEMTWEEICDSLAHSLEPPNATDQNRPDGSICAAKAKEGPDDAMPSRACRIALRGAAQSPWLSSLARG
jgi:hypothetical protein